MTDDPDQELQRRLATMLAEAQRKVLACQERLAKKADQLAKARTAMQTATDRLEEAQRLRDRIAAMPWIRSEQRDP